MRILQSDLDSIHLLTGDATGQPMGPAGIVLGSRASNRRVPIGSYGYDFAGIVQVAVPSNPGRDWRRLGVFGTPTIYFTDAQGRFGLGILGDKMPPVGVGAATCGA